MVIGIALALLTFQEIVDDVFYDPLEGDHEAQTFDRSLLKWAGEVRSPYVNQMMTDLTALGSVSVILTLFFVFASVLVTNRDYRGLSYMLIVLAGGAAWPSFLKRVFGRARPEEIAQLVNVTDLSFPSGHAFGSASVYIALAYYGAQYARSWPQEMFFYLLGLLLIMLVGISRVYLGVHYPTDVIAGISGGIAWGLLVSAIYERWVPRCQVPKPGHSA